MNHKSDSGGQTTECVGRFKFTAPQGWVETSRSQSIYRVDVRTIPLDSQNSFTVVWEKHIADIGKRYATHRVFELAPGTKAVWYFSDPTDKNSLALDVMKPYDDHVLHLSREVASYSKGQEPTERLFQKVLAAYVPQGQEGFCLGNGMLTSEVSQHEDSRIVFTRPSLKDFEISLETDTRGYSKAEDHWIFRFIDRLRPSDMGKEAKSLESPTCKVKVLREGRRTVAKRSGRECWIRMEETGKNPSLLFVWKFKGEADNALAPAMDIRASAFVDDQDQLEADWEALLKSLQPLPQPKA